VELFVVMAVIAVFAMMIDFPAPSHAKARALRIQCVNNLKQNGLAFRVWESDHGDNYPMAIPETNGGTMGFTTGPNAWRHFQLMSNELSTPKSLICPADDSRMPATNFVFLSNSNLSFFIGIEVANETNPRMILSGDHNITNGTPVKNGVLELTTAHPAAWTSEMHNKVGNIALADGSVQQVSIVDLHAVVANTGLATNRLQMPILAP
jgi:prepilin-type processing-associated H-X9-DG protein